MSRNKPTTERSGQGPSQRMLRVGELVRHKLAEMLVRGEIHDDVLAAQPVSVSEVRMTPDLKIATVFVQPLGGGNADEIITALARSKKFIRAQVAHAINLKFAPDICFRADESLDEVMRIERLLASEKVRQDVEKE